jgi:hypothetical protein
MLNTILIVVAVIALLFVVVVAIRPSAFRIERTAKMSAPPSAVFAEVNDFHRWEAWSPWEKLDPNLKRSYEGAAAGTGSIYSWSGNNKVGQGRMTIIESRPSDLVRIKLEFMRPFKATNIAEFSFVPEGNETAVSWIMTGTNNFFLKAFGLFVSMDKLVGGDFEKGLAAMKSVVEQRK